MAERASAFGCFLCEAVALVEPVLSRQKRRKPLAGGASSPTEQRPRPPRPGGTDTVTSPSAGSRGSAEAPVSPVSQGGFQVNFSAHSDASSHKNSTPISGLLWVLRNRTAFDSAFLIRSTEVVI